MVGMMGAVFNALDQEEFARFSGDRNPAHMDETLSRRMQAGAPVVHGVHTLLRVLNGLAEDDVEWDCLSRMRVRFLNWVYLGEPVEVILTSANEEDCSVLQATVHGLVVLSAELYCGKKEASAHSCIETVKNPIVGALRVDLQSLSDRAGDAYVGSFSVANSLFPQLSKRLGPAAVVELAACSYVVGMEVPGLYSMFSKLDVTLQIPSARSTACLRYRVQSVDVRFRKVKMDVRGSVLMGTVEAFLRMPPVCQPSMSETFARVSPGEFQGMRALVIGGSRGLGEATAKCIASGGGTCMLTYASGQEDALRVAGHIGGETKTFRYDALQAAEPQLQPMPGPFTHLFILLRGQSFAVKEEWFRRLI